jgi:putative transposase
VSLICDALAISRATVYRTFGIKDQSVVMLAPKAKHVTSPRALSEVERKQVIDVLHGDRFRDASPAHVYATLLDEGTYMCSERTMYRILAHLGENNERRSFVKHGQFHRPELLATGPNQVWSWDITRLMGSEKWNYFYLYVILDIFSRYVVGWMIAERELGEYAQKLIKECLRKQNIGEGQLTIHSDRGSPMKSKPVGFLLAELGVTKSLGRPQVSNDNPFSEAQFKTLKYCAEFPEKFGCIQDATSFGRSFFNWYNMEHKHSGIGHYSPEDVHYGRCEASAKRSLDKSTNKKS